MASTSAKLDHALSILRKNGHDVPEDSAVVGPSGNILLLVDGVLRTYNEIYALAGLPSEPGGG